MYILLGVKYKHNYELFLWPWPMIPLQQPQQASEKPAGTLCNWALIGLDIALLYGNMGYLLLYDA